MTPSLNSNPSPLASTASTLDDLSGRAASGVDDLRKGAPKVLSRAAAQVEDLARRGINRARDTGATVQEQVIRAGDRSVAYIRDEPVRSILIAAAAGAVVVTLIGWLNRSRH